MNLLKIQTHEAKEYDWSLSTIFFFFLNVAMSFLYANLLDINYTTWTHDFALSYNRNFGFYCLQKKVYYVSNTYNFLLTIYGFHIKDLNVMNEKLYV